MHRRLVAREFPRRFVCITFDDGYRDNHEFAYPILKKYEAPFAIYVATSFADRVGELWWLALEAVIAQNELIGIRIDGSDRWFEARNVPEKRAVYDHIYAWLRQLPTEDALRRVVRELTTRHRVDIGAFCGELCMDWQELATLAADPLVTIGAHTVNHPILTKVDDKTVRAELENSRAVIEAALGVRPRHLAYPVGDRDRRRPARVQDRVRSRLQHRGDDAARRDLPAAREPPHGAAAHLAQRQFPEAALRQGADLGLGHRAEQPLPPGECDLA